MKDERPLSKPPPGGERSIPPEVTAWLKEKNRQMAYDEYMEKRREKWLFASLFRRP